MSEYDVAKVRSHFPALDSGLAFFDGPGGSQTPDVVAEAVRATLVGPLSNRGDLTVAQENAERAVVGAREALADLLDTDPETGELDLASLDRALGERTRLVAVTGASNLIGTRPDLPAVAERVHAA